MAEQQTLQLKLSFPGEPSTMVAATLRAWTTLERARRAVFSMALCWTVAGLVGVIPAVRAFLPPLLLLAGPVVAALLFTEKTRLVGMKGSCPRCKTDREFQVDLRFSGPRSFTCDGCQSLIHLERA